jgi:hypothetical protein
MEYKINKKYKRMQTIIMMADTRYLNSNATDKVKWYYQTLAHERAHIYQQKIMETFNF